MATKAVTGSGLTTKKYNDDFITLKWLAVTNADTFAPVKKPSYADRSIQIDGTFGGATVKLQGSNDGVTYFDLHDPAGNVISMTSAGLKQILEVTNFTKPIASGGSGAQSLNVYLTAARK